MSPNVFYRFATFVNCGDLFVCVDVAFLSTTLFFLSLRLSFSVSVSVCSCALFSPLVGVVILAVLSLGGWRVFLLFEYSVNVCMRVSVCWASELAVNFKQ